MNSPTDREEITLITLRESERLNTYSLVLCAAGITHRVQCSSDGVFEIHIAQMHKERALYELSAYDRDNVPPRNIETLQNFAPAFRAMSVCVVAVLAMLYSLSGDWQHRSRWFIHGAGDANAILHNGELYRLLTSLTLHGDLVHLLSNCLIGIILLHFFFFLTGNGLGLAAILVTSVTASYINCLVNPQDHLFVGFSTAIFSIIGMLCSSSFINRPGNHLFHFFMPLMAGLSLLALLGSAGTRTDLGAHLFGLLCGLIVGYNVRLSVFLRLRDSFLWQLILGTLSVLLLLISWLIALA